MSRLIFVGQYMTKMRYQEWFPDMFHKKLSKYYDDIIMLGFNHNPYYGYYCDIKNEDSNKEMFSPINSAIEFELKQINEFMNMKIYDDDTLLSLDLSFPGFFSNVLYHKSIKNSYAYCHATSKNHLDYFNPIKFKCETANSKLYKKVFVATQYHADKLSWENTEIIGLPKPPFKTYKEEKIYNIISVARPCAQKITKSIEDEISRDYSDIIRKECNTWEEYYRFLSMAKVLLITSKEETFGYPVLESIQNNCIPLCPNRCSYPELLPKDYLYNDIQDLKYKLSHALNGQLERPKELLNQNLIDNFFKNLVNHMKGYM
jgi:hypothetical protein